MISAILVGVVVFLIANLFLAAGTAGLIGFGRGNPHLFGWSRRPPVVSSLKPAWRLNFFVG